MTMTTLSLAGDARERVEKRLAETLPSWQPRGREVIFAAAPKTNGGGNSEAGSRTQSATPQSKGHPWVAVRRRHMNRRRNRKK